MSRGLVNPRIVCGGSRAQGRDAVRMVLWAGINPGNGLISVLERSFSYLSAGISSRNVMDRCNLSSKRGTDGAWLHVSLVGAQTSSEKTFQHTFQLNGTVDGSPWVFMGTRKSIQRSDHCFFRSVIVHDRAQLETILLK